MDNNFGQYVPQSYGKKKAFSIVGLICSSVGALLTLVFSIITCSRGYEASCSKKGVFDYKLDVSLWSIGVWIAVAITVTGIVFSILSIEKGARITKLAIISIIVGAFAFMYAIVSNLTICAYNCEINDGKAMKSMNKMYKSYSSSSYDDDYDDYDYDDYDYDYNYDDYDDWY